LAGNQAVSQLVSPQRRAEPRHLVVPSQGLVVPTGAIAQRDPKKGAPPTIDKRVTRIEIQNKATAHLSEFQNGVLAAAEDWEMAALNVGSAYATAADRHTQAITDAQRIVALNAQIMGSVMVVLLVGPMGWLAEGLPGILSQGFEDFAQAGMGEALSAVGPAVIAATDAKPASTNPQVFQNEAVGKVKNAKKGVYEYFASCFKEIAKATPESWDKYDEGAQQTKHKQWLEKAKSFGGAKKLPSVEEMANEFERGFWAKWAPGLYKGVTYAIFPQVHYAALQKPVQARLTAVGITSAAGLKFGWFSDDDDARKTIKWGEGYKSVPFM